MPGATRGFYPPELIFSASLKGRWGYLPISQMRRLRLRDAGTPGYTLPQCVPWSSPLPPTTAHPGPALSHGPGFRGWWGIFEGGEPKEMPKSVCQGVVCLRKRGETFALLRAGPRLWSCRHLQLWPWPRPLCPPPAPPLAGYSETRFGRGASLGGETVLKRTLEPAQTPLYFCPSLAARKGLQGPHCPHPLPPPG